MEEEAGSEGLEAGSAGLVEEVVVEAAGVEGLEVVEEEAGLEVVVEEAGASGLFSTLEVVVEVAVEVVVEAGVDSTEVSTVEAVVEAGVLSIVDSVEASVVEVVYSAAEVSVEASVEAVEFSKTELMMSLVLTIGVSLFSAHPVRARAARMAMMIFFMVCTFRQLFIYNYIIIHFLSFVNNFLSIISRQLTILHIYRSRPPRFRRTSQ